MKRCGECLGKLSGLFGGLYEKEDKSCLESNGSEGRLEGMVIGSLVA